MANRDDTVGSVSLLTRLGLAFASVSSVVLVFSIGILLSQYRANFLHYVSLTVLFAFVVFVVPLVSLVSGSQQIRFWYLILLASVGFVFAVLGTLLHETPWALLRAPNGATIIPYSGLLTAGRLVPELSVSAPTRSCQIKSGLAGEGGFVNRRRLLQSLGISAAAVGAGPLRGAGMPVTGTGFLTLQRQPDAVRVFLGDAEDVASPKLQRSGERWSTAGVSLQCAVTAAGLAISLLAENKGVRRVHLRWQGAVAEDALVLGDAWERSYGDLAWLPVEPERPLPWYCLLHTAAGTHGYGVKTGAAAFAFWQVDTAGVSLWLDVRNGGSGVRLGRRELRLARVVERRCEACETAFAATKALCGLMAPIATMPAERGGLPVATIFGSNDWYYAYGKNTPAGILRDAELMRELAPAGGPRPFTVIDDGYQDRAVFPDMAKLAAELAAEGVVPGVWIRPLRAAPGTPEGQLLPMGRFGRHHEGAEGSAYDPTVPEGRAAALAVVREARAWGYRLIKHDFSTWELLGQWGFQMGASPTLDGWSFHDRSVTNAEIVASLYEDIRGAAGEDRLVLGCNTVGHLAAGIFDAQRTGDDVSGKDWERTRRMGVNTLAFRLPQHRTFFSLDADCVPITAKVPWALTEQWLRAVAATGSVLLVSPEPGALPAEGKRVLREAFARCAAAARGPAEPEDWLETRTPALWAERGGRPTKFGWVEPGVGASPFPL